MQSTERGEEKLQYPRKGNLEIMRERAVKTESKDEQEQMKEKCIN